MSLPASDIMLKVLEAVQGLTEEQHKLLAKVLATFFPDGLISILTDPPNVFLV